MEQMQGYARSSPYWRSGHAIKRAHLPRGGLTTLVILGLGFGGGLMLARSALKEPSGYQTRANAAQITPVRVILPASAEPAQPPQPSSAVSALPPQAQPVSDVQAPVQKTVASAETGKKSAVADERRELRQRYAERKARRMAARAGQMERNRERFEPGILAFGGDGIGDFRN